MKEFQCQHTSFKLAEKNFYLYPISKNSKIPLKDTKGYLDATNDENTLLDWSIKEPYMNLGMRLDTSNLLVVDVDMHGEKDGRDSLIQLKKQGKELDYSTYQEKTPSGGIHLFYKYDGKATRKINLLSGVDILTDFVIIAPSEINGVQYETIKNRTFDDVKPVPNWIIDLMKPDSPKQDFKYNIKFPSRKKYMGSLLDEIVTGTEVGNRNDWLTQITGKLFWTGANPETVYNLLCYANENLSNPLDTKEVNYIFKSIIRRQQGVS